MNSTIETINNLLFLPKNREYHDELFGSLLKLIALDKTVLVITRSASSPKLLPLMEKAGIEVYKNKQSLQRLFFMCCDNIYGVTKKLFDLYKWAIKPHIIVLDLYAFSCCEEENADFPHENLSSGSLLKRFMLCIAVLFNNMNVVNNIHRGTTHSEKGDKNVSKIFSIVVLPKSRTLLNELDFERIIDMYYYNNTYEEFEEIFEMISTISSNQIRV